ncbi:hypothetical protein BDQ17DRAFT_1229560 [Cyathus striatus]|nr:hypothetical protein BDQ17DRAFT_1229560 [Cyathus striatus]
MYGPDDPLPPFLKVHKAVTMQSHTSFHNAMFDHQPPLAPTHAIWWPSKKKSAAPVTVILFIPGNPGLLDFYTPFLTALHDKAENGKLAILAHSHIYHTPGVMREPEARMHNRHSGLTYQVQSAIEAFDALKTNLPNQTKIVVIGHSVGAWISLQVILRCRGDAISALFLLFPTISNIAQTPNGKRLSANILCSQFFFSPLARLILSRASYLTNLLPTACLSWIFKGWPIQQIRTLQILLNSSSSIEAALFMASDEMDHIKSLDISLLKQYLNRLWFYYAEKDDWVGEEKGRFITSMHPDRDNLQIVHGEQDIPHAFCINHGEKLAQQCHVWLQSAVNI